MRENQLPVHYTSDEETGRIRTAGANSGDGGVHIPRENVTQVEARPAGNYLAEDFSNSVQITLAKRVIKPGSDKAMCLAAQTSIPISDDEISSVSNLGLKLADGTKVALSLSFFNDEAAQNVTPMRGAEPPMHFSTAGAAPRASAVAVAPRALPGPRNQYVVYDPERYTKLEEARDSKLGTWLITSALVSVATLYTICNPKWVPAFISQSVKISKQVSADIKRRASTPLGGTAVTGSAQSATGGAVAGRGVAPGRGVGAAPGQVAPSVSSRANVAVNGSARNAAVRTSGHAAAVATTTERGNTSGTGHKSFTSDRDENGIRESGHHHGRAASHNAKSSGHESVGFDSGVLPALSPQSKPVSNSPLEFMNQGFNQGFSFPAPEMPKAAEAKTSKNKKGFMVPPPPPTPCVLPPAFGFFPMQAQQQHAAVQQQQSAAQAQSQAAGRARSQAIAKENVQQQAPAPAAKSESIQPATNSGPFAKSNFNMSNFQILDQSAKHIGGTSESMPTRSAPVQPSQAASPGASGNQPSTVNNTPRVLQQQQQKQEDDPF